jgi:hypothetical protein
MLWYRTSPRALITFGPSYKVTPIDPPLAVPGMTLVVLDTFGRLQQFRAVPPQIDTDSPPQSPQWDTLFVAAGLPMSTFAAVTPTWMPRDFADTRAAWEGPVPERPDLRVRVEMAAYRGRPVSFLLIGPWTQANRTQAITRTTTQTVLRSFFVVVAFAILVGAMLIAWHHLRTSRADLRGATRLSLWMLGSFAVEWVVANHHIADIAIEWSGFGRWLGGPLLESAIVWVVYLAVEPYVRRFWPDGILGWTRLFAGHIRDPRVGRDVLLGCTFGVLLALVQMATLLVPPLFGATAGPRSFGTNLSALIGPSAVVVTFINALWSDVVMSLFAVMAIVLLRLIFRRPRLAAAVFVLVLAVIQMQNVLTYTGSLWAVVVWEIVLIVAITVLLLRFGLLVLAVSFFIGETLGAIPLTLAASRWWAAGSNITLIALIAFVCFGFYASRAGQPLLGITET